MLNFLWQVKELFTQIWCSHLTQSTYENWKSGIGFTKRPPEGGGFLMFAWAQKYRFPYLINRKWNLLDFSACSIFDYARYHWWGFLGRGNPIRVRYALCGPDQELALFEKCKLDSENSCIFLHLNLNIPVLFGQFPFLFLSLQNATATGHMVTGPYSRWEEDAVAVWPLVSIILASWIANCVEVLFSF